MKKLIAGIVVGVIAIALCAVMTPEAISSQPDPDGPKVGVYDPATGTIIWTDPTLGGRVAREHHKRNWGDDSAKNLGGELALTPIQLPAPQKAALSATPIIKLNAKGQVSATPMPLPEPQKAVLSVTPTIKMTANGKVANFPLPMPEPAAGQVTIQRAERGGKIATNPQPFPLPQPAVSHAKPEKAVHSVVSLNQPMPRPVPRAAVGRR